MVTQNPAALRPGDYLEPGTYRVSERSTTGAAGSPITLMGSLRVNSWGCVIVGLRHIHKAFLTPALADGPMPADDEPDERPHAHCEIRAAGTERARLATPEPEPSRLPHSLYWTDAHGVLHDAQDVLDGDEAYEVALLRAALAYCGSL